MKSRGDFKRAMADFMHLAGLFMVSDALHLLSWIDTLKGYKGKMKKTAEEIGLVVGSLLTEHHQKRKNESINHLEEDFIYVMLPWTVTSFLTLTSMLPSRALVW